MADAIRDGGAGGSPSEPAVNGQALSAIASLTAALQESDRRFGTITEASLQAKLAQRRLAPLVANVRFLEMFGFADMQAQRMEHSLSRLFDLNTQANLEHA